ncbi:MAG TPA: hypothetical protein VHE83_07270 [Mycobacteriales bacterium]|nr:hypothetical protein [Mycobacteriales bacterium]
MYIGVLHTVTDKKTWATKLAEFQKGTPPPGYTNPITFIGAKTDYAFCLWDAPSVDALQPMLDELTQGAATNLYFAVDPKALGTSGIPAQRIDLDTAQKAKAASKT